jgi:hypothetical protein
MEPQPASPELSAPPSTVPTRRVFVMAGVTFLVGTTTGGWWGYAAGSEAAASERQAAELAPTGDADLDELRRLAVKAPIEELLQRRLVFLANLGRTYRSDRVLWRGFDRLVEVALHGEGVPDDRLLGRLLAQHIEYADPDFQAPRLHLAPRLRELK